MSKLPFEFDASKYPVEAPSPAPATPAQPDELPAVPPSVVALMEAMGQPVTPADPANVDPSWAAAQQVPPAAPTKSRFVSCHFDRNTGNLVIDDIPDGYTEEEADIIREWYPQLINKPSPHIDNPHGVVINGEDVLKHVAALVKEQRKAQAAQNKLERAGQREQRAEARARYTDAYSKWEEECRERKAIIEAASEAWRKAGEDRRAAIAQWDAYVAEFRRKAREAKDLPVPPRPNKADFD